MEHISSEMMIDVLKENTYIKLPLIKIFSDKILAIFLLILTLPVSLLICLAIKLEGLFVPKNRGPIFHWEERVSQDKPFNLYKFRILKLGAGEEIRKGKCPKDVENNPENLTNTGKVLKKIGLDEMPQFWNILKGNMSFVGPRPKPVAEYQAEVDKGIYSRKVIRAGLSGPVQVMKGTVRTYEDQLKADLDYVEKCRDASSIEILLTDFSIIIKTIKVLLKRTGE